MRFCPLCGKTDSQGAFCGELCQQCAASRLPSLPAVRLVLCQKCGAIMDRAGKRKQATLSEEVVRLLRLRRKNAEYDGASSSVSYDSSFGRISQPVAVLKSQGVCAECSRAASSYFEAIIQLRGAQEKVERTARRLLGLLEKKSFVPKIEKLKEGLDLYCGSRNEAIAALNSLSLGFLRTEKLAGQRSGKRLYRTTLLVRL
ncbi:MAG: NMD3-related protein [Candidatus Micrarchaeota archaeon]|nr:NMD3-related protein [Candidatus Micrarchaeota archaeon]